jgi:heparanase 1
MYYDLGNSPLPAPPPFGYQAVMTRDMWNGMAGFAADLDLDIVFTLNAGPGPRGDGGDRAWRPDNARNLLEYSAAHHHRVAVWELGNEVHAYPLFHRLQISPTRYAADLATARALVDEVHGGGLLAGPSSAYWPEMGEVIDFLAPMLAAGGGRQLDILSWHYYPQQSLRCPLANLRAEPGLLLHPHRLNDIGRWLSALAAARDRARPGLRLWLGETGNAQCGGEPGVSDRFEGGFWWLDELGQTARAGQEVVIRQTLSGSNYGLIDDETLEPNPDYWSSLLWRRLIGTGVLAVTVLAGDANLRVYAHCAQARPGDVALVLINLDRDRAAEVVTGVEADGVELYQLSAPQPASHQVWLNGQLLAPREDGTPPQTLPVALPSVGGARIRVAAQSYAFAVLRGANARACNLEESL